MRDGCPNCESFLELMGQPDAIQECTSQVFEGILALGDPQQSWMARYQRLTNYVPGSYALKVVGVLPDEVLRTMEDNGIRYIPRDGSEQVDER